MCVEHVRLYKTPALAANELKKERDTSVVYSGDCLDLLAKMPDNSVSCTISSPPYCIGKEYEISRTFDDFFGEQSVVLPEVARVTKPGGSICWQIGYYVRKRQAVPLDFVVYSILAPLANMFLRNRIIWTYGHGIPEVNRFSGRHETVLWFTKGDKYDFDLDAVREPQKYPGKRKYKGPKRGEFSSNPKGKNPGDVWAIPNVKAMHVERAGHPCQFPVGLADRLVRALSPRGALVFDPYMGAGFTGVAAVLNGRRFLGSELNRRYVKIAVTRLAESHAGTVRYRPAEQPIYVPGPGLAVARRPAHFQEHIR